MFFDQRHTFPGFYILFMVSALVLAGLDLLAIHWLSIPDAPVTSKDIRQWIIQGVSVVIWSMYFMKSERVKSTFTKSRYIDKPVRATC